SFSTITWELRRRRPVRVLLIEDHKPLVRALRRGLEEEGFAVDTALDGEEGAYKAQTADYDVIILDLMLPKEDGLSLLQRWRRAGLKSQVLVLTARSGIEDKVRGLNLGADDYLTKPFELEELLARLRALVRRGHQIKDPVVRVHDLEIDTASRTVKRGGQSVHLTPREYALLEFLAFHRGKVVTRSMIWEHLYDEHDECRRKKARFDDALLQKALILADQAQIQHGMNRAVTEVQFHEGLPSALDPRSLTDQATEFFQINLQSDRSTATPRSSSMGDRSFAFDLETYKTTQLHTPHFDDTELERGLPL